MAAEKKSNSANSASKVVPFAKVVGKKNNDIVSTSPVEIMIPEPISMPQSSSSDEMDVKVVVRVRPMNNKEITAKSTPCLILTQKENKISISRKDKEEKTFYFDQVFGENITQEELYKGTGKKVFERFILGYNVSTIAVVVTTPISRHVFSPTDKRHQAKPIPCSGSERILLSWE